MTNSTSAQQFLSELDASTLVSIDGSEPQPVIKMKIAIAFDDLLFRVGTTEFDVEAAQVAKQGDAKGTWLTEDHNAKPRTVRFVS